MIDLFLRTLGSAASQRRVEKLAEALERVARDIFRMARQLENGCPRAGLGGADRNAPA